MSLTVSSAVAVAYIHVYKCTSQIVIILRN